MGATKSSAVRVLTLTGSIPSMWGLRGKQDLGGGLSAVFVMESAFAPSQGTLNQGGRLFGRQAYVGLAGHWGTLTLGRQYSQIYWALPGDTMGPNIYAAGDPFSTRPATTGGSAELIDFIKKKNSHVGNPHYGPAGPPLYEQAQTSYSGSCRSHGWHQRALGTAN
ncbi:porin [Paraburkholderia pallida]|uniref:porin n=1 Tax=Paraburkholderia pallida TaxID=2547399 RepID=UPI003005577C